MKMAPVSSLTLLLLCCFVSSGSLKDCDQHEAMGSNVTIKLTYELTGTETLKWKMGSEIIYHKKGDKFINKKKGDVGLDGFLKLTNVTKGDNGRYEPEVFLSNGKSIPDLKSTALCVWEPVGKPQAKVTKCKDKKVEFNCTVAETDGTGPVDYKWLLGDKVMGTTPILKLDPTKVEHDEFTCKVSNKASSMISDPVTQNCHTSGFTLPEELFGINIWILVGAGAGIVLLLIILVIICCVRARRTKRMRLKDEEELRLEFTNPERHEQYQHPADRHHHHHHHRQHHHHHHHQQQQQQQQQQPAGHTGPRPHRSKQHRNQPLPRAPDQPNGPPQPSPRRPAQAPKPANDEQPPPLPQPRKKTPRKV